MRILRQELYFPLIIGIHFVMWGVDLYFYEGTFLEPNSDTMFWGEYTQTEGIHPLRIIGEVFSSWVVTVFAFNFLMATRARWVERIFGGLDKMYLIHRRSGVIAVVLLIAHFITVPRDLTAFTPGKPMGFYALILILVGVVISAAPPLKRKIPYHIWIRIHRFMGIFYVMGVVHAALVFSLIRELPMTRIYVFGMAAVGVVSWFYRAFLYRLFNRELEYTVVKTHSRSTGVIELVLEPKSDRLKYKAGQFAFFRFPSISKAEQHPFTLSSHPADENLRVTVKGLGDFTKRLPAELREGASVFVEGPYGHYTLDSVKQDDQVWVAGGIGITPFLSLARDIDKQRVRLFWCVGEESEACYSEELEAVARDNPNFDFEVWASKAKGPITADAVSASRANEKESAFLLCGPPGLKGALTKQLRARSVPRNQILDEEFAFR